MAKRQRCTKEGSGPCALCGQLATDRMLYGNSFELQGKRVHPALCRVDPDGSLWVGGSRYLAYRHVAREG